MLKSKISIFRGGGVIHLPTFDAESKNAEIQSFHFFWGGVIHLPTFDAESKNAEIQNFHFQGSGGEGVGHQLSNSNLKFSKSNPELKFQFLGRGVSRQLTFDAEFKFAKTRCARSGLKVVRPLTIPKSSAKFSKSNPELKFPFSGWGGVRTQLSKSNPKFSKSNPELKFPFSGWGGGGVQTQLSKSNAKFSKSNPELKFPFRGGGGEYQLPANF